MSARERRLERLGPRLLHVERNRIGQERLEAFGRDFRRVHIEPRFLGDLQIEAQPVAR
jgi:hypothetical protein